MNTQFRPLPHFTLRLLPVLLMGLLAGCATREDLKKEVQPYSDRMQNMESWFNAINSGLDTQSKRIRELEIQQTRLDKGEASRQSRLDSMAADTAALASRVDGQGAMLADLGRKMDAQSSQSAGQGRRLEGVAEGMSKLDTRLSGLEQSLAAVSPSSGRAEAASAGMVQMSAPAQAVPAAGNPAVVFVPEPTAPALAPAAAPTPVKTDPAGDRLAALEARMADLLQRGQEQGALIAALNRRFDDLRGDLAQVRAKSDGNGQAISQVDTRVETLSGHLEAARSRVEAEEKAVAETGLRLTLVQELVKGQSERLSRSEIENGRISATAQEALDRARQAGKLAEGKLVFETTLSDEITHFGVAEASLNESAKKQLEEFAARLKVENKGVFIEIQGHTDNLGPADANLRLSRERAQAVRDYLNQVAGIPLHRLAIAAYGESKPVADNKTRDGRSRNRRVLLVVLQ